MGIVVYEKGDSMPETIGGIAVEGRIVDKDNVYCMPILALGNEQDCGTVWFNSIEACRAMVRKLGTMPDGQNTGLCTECGCSYSPLSELYGKYPEFACKTYKEKIRDEADKLI